MSNFPTQAIEKTIVVGAFQCNCRIVVCPMTGDGLVIDPGDEAPKIIEQIKNTKLSNGVSLKVKWLLHTHAHLDHIGGTAQLKEGLASDHNPKIALHKGDEKIYYALKMQCQMFGLDYGDPRPIDEFLVDGQILKVGELKLEVLHVPGHSPGSVGFRLHGDTRLGVTESLFSGDTLFYQSVGRTDLWEGNQDLMFKSIKSRFLTLDDETRVCPGHGPDTKIGIEKRENPFLN
jgi:hydroxyacylglutathione hydrolase